MRFLLLAITIVVSGCMSTGAENVRGAQQKTGFSELDKIRYDDPRYVRHAVSQCRAGRVLWCDAGRGKADCRCVFEHDVDARAERLLGRRPKFANRQRGPNSRNH